MSATSPMFSSPWFLGRKAGIAAADRAVLAGSDARILLAGSVAVDGPYPAGNPAGAGWREGYTSQLTWLVSAAQA